MSSTLVQCILLPAELEQAAAHVSWVGISGFFLVSVGWGGGGGRTAKNGGKFKGSQP